MNLNQELFKVLSRPNRLLSVLSIFKDWAQGYFDAQSSVDVDKAKVIEVDADDRIAFNDHAVYPYLFAFVYVLYSALFLITLFDSKDYKKAKRLIKKLISSSNQIFVEYPTKMKPRTRSNHLLLKYAQSIDGETNCCPSLHVSLASLVYQIISSQSDMDQELLKAMRVSCIDICRSTLETKQHSIIDVVSGIYISKTIFESECDNSIFDNIISEIIPELKSYELEAINNLIYGKEISIKDFSEKVYTLLS